MPKSLDEVLVLRWRRRRWLDSQLSANMRVERLIDFMLQAKRSAHCLRIETRRAKLFHYFPVPVSPDDVPEPLGNDVSDVEALVLICEEHSARGNTSGA